MTHAAQSTAQKADALFKCPTGSVRRVFDTDFPNRPACWLVRESVEESWAIVVYEDEPRTIVSAGNRPGRYQDAPL